jgi:hypothetical protein
VVLKHGKKVAVGCQSGVLSIFSWGYWNDCSDRFPGHPESGEAPAGRARTRPDLAPAGARRARGGRAHAARGRLTHRP